jgi:hypothetical protein
MTLIVAEVGWRLAPIVGAWLIIASSTAKPDEAHVFARDAGPSLERDVLPLMKAHCVKCHGPIKPKGKLNLSGPKSIARGGASGPIVEPGKPDDSMMWDMISSGEMPPEPEHPLSANEKATLRRWIELGAIGLPESREAARSRPETDHWAFAALTRPAPPSVRDHQRVRTSVDRFIQRALEDRGLALGPDADRETLIRRVSFDLIGLPPSPAEVAAFLADRAPAAYERVVDRLLASPHYGERWGKHWLDASGYADSNGYFSADSDRPLAYRYRDYVIRAFRSDRPLDRVVCEQLAGDEMAGNRAGPYTSPEVIDQLVATHFLRNSQDGTGESDGNPDEVKVDKYSVLEGTIQVIGSSLLGLTLQCARCHDHKFEPVTQREYYQLEAILYPALNVDHWLKPNERTVIAGPRGELSRWEAEDRARSAEIAALRRTFVSGPDAEKKQRDEALQPAFKRIEARRRPNPGRIAWVGDVSLDPPEIPLLVRGNHATPGAMVGPGAPDFLTDADNRYQPQPVRMGPAGASGGISSGRRLALARWLTHPGSRPAAILARVLANRIWQHHFGTGLASTSDNLGYSGSTPSHPELLEFLACELVRSSWSSKAVHRLIVTSTVYRQSSAHSSHAETARIDPENRLLARYPLRRLDAEQIRDAMLAVAGELDERLGGPYVPADRNDCGEVVVDESDPGARRRSVYLQQRRTQIVSLLDVFDAPSIVTTCTRRLPSTIPLQSLCLLNSGFVAARAAKLADRLRRECEGPDTGSPGECCFGPGQTDDADVLVARAFLIVAGRAPGPDEREATRRFLKAQPDRYTGLSPARARDRACVDFCQMLLASDSFLYVE